VLSHKSLSTELFRLVVAIRATNSCRITVIRSTYLQGFVVMRDNQPEKLCTKSPVHNSLKNIGTAILIKLQSIGNIPFSKIICDKINSD